MASQTDWEKCLGFIEHNIKPETALRNIIFTIAEFDSGTYRKLVNRLKENNGT